MRVLSFQSGDVINILINKGIYYADCNLSREKQNYIEDIKQLNGYNPIWCFIPKNKIGFTKEDFKDGTRLERFRCEMSLDQKIGLTKFYMLELEIDEKDLKHGITHNAYEYAYVTHYIEFNQLKAVYIIQNTNHWYFKKIIKITCYSNDTIFGWEFIGKEE